MAVSVVATANNVTSSNRTPTVTFASYTPLENDVIALFAACTDPGSFVIAVTGWVNALGGTTINSAAGAHTQACYYHLVTSAEQTAVTLTYGITNMWDFARTGNVVAIALRGVDPAIVMDSVASTFNTSAVTPFVLAGLTGTNLSNNSLVVSAVAKDATGTFTTPAGWTVRTSNNTNQGNALYTRDALTIANTNVTATNITPSASDQYTSITIAFAELGGAVGPVLAVYNYETAVHRASVW